MLIFIVLARLIQAGQMIGRGVRYLGDWLK